MGIAVKSHALPVYKKHRIASLLCIFESTIQYTLVFLVYFGSYTITKTFFTKCCMVGCGIQNICAITTQIESSICKLVEQN